ncbi:MAG: hypothetical protein GX131_05425 [candidate division WS1 bacterium]|nr:hypothetical protein [candidate division WS1 bacterium]
MLQKSAAVSGIIALTLLAMAWAEPIAGFPANAGFDAPADGWTLPEGGRVVEGDGARGGALSLAGGWAISAPAEQPLSGWLLVSLRAKGPGDRSSSELALSFVTDDAAPRAAVAVPASALGSNWRRVEAQLLVPAAGSPRIAIGVRGEEAWLIDEITVEQTHFTAAEEPAIVPEVLPEGWEPEGMLDAIERVLGAGRELLLHVGGMQIGLPQEVSAERGHRGALRVMVTNRGAAAKELTVSVAGPPGFFAPERTVSIKPGGDTIFRASVQAFALGDHTVRVTFRSGGEEASAPIRVSVSESYPAAGLSFHASAPSADELAQATELGAQLLAVRQPSGQGTDHVLPPHYTRMLLLGGSWSAEALHSAVVRLGGAFEFMAMQHLRGEEPLDQSRELTDAIVRAAEAADEVVWTVSPPVDLLSGSPMTIAEDDLALVRGLRMEAGATPSLRLPPIGGANLAAAVTVDGKAVATVQPGWTELAARTNLDAVTRAIRTDLATSLFFPDLAAAGTGSPEADAAIFARTLVGCLYQGAIGFTVPARSLDAPGAEALCPLGSDGPAAAAFRELSRELSAATPLVIFNQSPEIGSADDALVGFRPFMRGDEGILALWNNTGAPMALIVETRTQPLDLHTVAIGPAGVSRSYRGSFRYSEEAIALNRPVLFVDLEPGELKVLSMQLARPHMGWLAAVEEKPEVPRGSNRPKTFFEDWEERNLYH